MAILGLNPWTISGIILILLGTYMVHKGSKQTLMNALDNSSEKIMNHNSEEIDNSTKKITSELNDHSRSLDSYLLNVYKPNFDDCGAALSKYASFSKAVIDIQNDALDGTPKNPQEKEKMIKAIQGEINTLNNKFGERLKRLEDNWGTIKIIHLRGHTNNVDQLLAQHKSNIIQAKQSFYGINENQKSYIDAFSFFQTAEKELVAIMYITGSNK